jgi:CHAD domain-containing protein
MLLYERLYLWNMASSSLIMINNDLISIPGIKQSLSTFVSEAASLVGKGDLISDSDIHDARVSLKKARAILKLIRSQVQDDFFKREYETFRKSGRALCDLRESTVHRKLLKELKKKSPVVFRNLDNELVEKLIKKPEKSEGMAAETLKSLDGIATSLQKSVYRIRFEPLGNLKQAGLLRDLGSTWSEVRNDYLGCRMDSSVKKIHEFRKRAKDFMYQLAFFKPYNPSQVKSVQKKSDVMTRGLGRHHDLAVLLKAIDYKSTSGNSPYFDELAILIKGEQDRVLAKVWPLAYGLFGPSSVLEDKLGVKVLILESVSSQAG